MLLNGTNFIGSRQSKNGESFKSYSLSNDNYLETLFYKATDGELEEATQLSHQAFLEYRKVSPTKRADFLDEVAKEIVGCEEALLEIMPQETGLPAPRVSMEMGRTANQFKMFARVLREGSYVEAVIDRADKNRQPLPKPDTRRCLEPIGPIVVFSASNFPLAFSVGGGDTASALAGGNTVIVKAHSSHPATSEIIAQAILRAITSCQMPDGTFSMLHGSGRTTGQALVKSKYVKAVGFTGSLNGGRELFDIANKRKEPIPVFAEMGSINPVVILPKALKTRPEGIAEMFANSVNMGVGQFCTKPGLLIVQNTEGIDQFFDTLKAKFEAFDYGCMLNKNINDTYLSSIEETLKERSIEKIASSTKEANNNRVSPTIVKCSAKDFINTPAFAEEIFGPYSLVVVCDTPCEGKEVLSTLEGQLTATLIGEEDEYADYQETIQWLRDVSGRLIFNAPPTGVEVNFSMVHGGGYPASTDNRFTSVGAFAIKRFLKSVCYQDTPQAFLPEVLKDDNPLNIFRIVDEQWTKE